MEESLVPRELLLIEWRYLHLILIVFHGARIHTEDVCADPRDQQAHHEGPRELFQSEGNAHVEDGVAKQEVEGQLSLEDVCVQVQELLL